MKKLTKILMMLAAFLLLASCGSKQGDNCKSESGQDPDHLMNEILRAGRDGAVAEVMVMEKMLLEQKMTVDQARRYIFEIEPKTAWLEYDGGGWNEGGFFYDNWDIDEDCKQVLREITEEQILSVSHGAY